MPAIVVFPGANVLDGLPEKERAELQAMRNEAAGVLKGLREIVVDSVVPSGMRGYILNEALASGWLRYEEGKTPDTVGAYLYR